MSSPILGGVTISGAQIVTINASDYIVEHQIPGVEGGIIEREGSQKNRITINGFLVDTADSQLQQLQGMLSTTQFLTVPSLLSGNYFIASGSIVQVEKLLVNQEAGRNYSYYPFKLQLVAVSVIVNISGTFLYVATSGDSTRTVAVVSGGVLPTTILSGSVAALSGLSTIVQTSGANQVTIGVSGNVPLVVESAANPWLRTTIYAGTTQASAGAFGGSDSNAVGNGALLVSPYNQLYDAGGNVWARMKNVPSTSGTTGTSILSVGNMAFDYSGIKFYPLATATSGSPILGVSVLSGAGSSNISGGVTVSGQVQVSGLKFDANSNLNIAITQGANTQAGVASVTDGISLGTIGVYANSLGMVMGAASWDRLRNVALASGATAASGIGLLGAGILALNPASNYEPLQSVSGALKVTSGGTIPVSIVTGGVQVSGTVGISGGAAGLSGLIVLISGQFVYTSGGGQVSGTVGISGQVVINASGYQQLLGTSGALQVTDLKFATFSAVFSGTNLPVAGQGVAIVNAANAGAGEMLRITLYPIVTSGPLMMTYGVFSGGWDFTGGLGPFPFDLTNTNNMTVFPQRNIIAPFKILGAIIWNSGVNVTVSTPMIVDFASLGEGKRPTIKSGTQFAVQLHSGGLSQLDVWWQEKQ